MTIRTREISTYKYGIIDQLEDRSIPIGSSSGSLNWLTKGDKIELRRGYKYIGTKNTGVGKITGLRKITDANSVEHLWTTFAQKVKYFDRTTEDFVELGSDVLGSDADGEDISMSEYVSNAGNQLFINSPNIAEFIKILVSNPDDYTNIYLSAKNFKGHIKIDTNACFLWGRNKDQTGIYRSYIDEQNYTTVSVEALADVSSGTLAFKSGDARRTCFAIEITHTGSGEVFTDNFDGTLTGSAGGTGTINYTTGAFTTSLSGAGTVDYQWEDSTDGGLGDFTKSATRLAGEGAIWRQDEGGGPVKNIGTYNNVYYCFHTKKTWALTIAIDDTPSGTSNLPYRQRVGIPNLRAFVETGEGIYYVDDQDENDPRLRLLTYSTGGAQEVLPISKSNNVNLNNYIFDQAVGFEYGDFVLFACRQSGSTKNDRTILINKIWNSIDILDYAVSCFEVYDGALMGGDSLTNNVMELFSGFDDDESDIPNYWEGNLDDLDIEGLKKSKKLLLQGEIGPEQKIKVSLSVDNGPFVEVGGSTDDSGNPVYAIEGDGSYIDTTQRVSVGPQTLGRGEVGGGSDGAVAYNYERLFKLSLGSFDKIKIRYEAVGLGYASVSTTKFWDIRFKGKKVASKYRG